LFDAIKREGPFGDHIVAQIVRDTADALRFLHRNNIVHRDIKPENLLLCYDYHVKLTDFGLACEVRGKLYRVCGTPTYVAPEILSEIGALCAPYTHSCVSWAGYGCEVDIWSLGIIMHILLCGYAPFRSTDRNRLFELIKQGSLSLIEPVWIKVDTGGGGGQREVNDAQPPNVCSSACYKWTYQNVCLRARSWRTSG
jgi:serine/threonine protein kinase